jgi:TupA-like ATPgrasp
VLIISSISLLKRNPKELFNKLILRTIRAPLIRNILPSKFCINVIYKLKFGIKPDLKNPIKYNEKLQWLKLYYRNQKYTELVDKYEVRKYVKNTIGEKYLIPLLGIYNDFEEIDFSKLPNKFVIKCTHDSGGLIICDDKSKFDIRNARKKINKSMNRNYYYVHREWPYKKVKPRIICEEFLSQGDNGEELRDYRFFCFNGEPHFIAVDFSITDKTKTRRNLYDLNWNLLDVEVSYPKEERIVLNKPEKFDEMIELSKKLSRDFPHVRVDFYYVNNQIKFGEMTFYHQSGLGEIRPGTFDIEWGNLLKLPI